MTMLGASERRGIAELFRRYAALQRELSAAKALLMLCEAQKIYPQDWPKHLDAMKNTPACSKIVQELDTIASHLEQSADEIDLTELLSKLPKGTAPN
jgi:hypothetical protein